MSNSKIVIVGSYGQLGKALASHLEGAFCVDRDRLDITDQAAVESFDWSGVEILINAAAYTNVDGAETTDGRRAAWQINSSAVSNLARVAIKHDLTMIHISSDYVYDGTVSPHSEEEPLTPLGVYAQTKAAGDLVVSTVPKHYILRISWLIGDGPNFVRTMIGLAGRDISPSVVNDQVGRLTFTPELVGAIDYLLVKESAYGLYNFSGAGEAASWADITKTIFKEVGRDDLKVTRVSTEDYYRGKDGIAPRPLQSALDLSKIEAAGFTVQDWRVSLQDYIKKELS